MGLSVRFLAGNSASCITHIQAIAFPPLATGGDIFSWGGEMGENYIIESETDLRAFLIKTNERTKQRAKLARMCIKPLWDAVEFPKDRFPGGWEQSVLRFVDKLGPETVIEAAELVGGRHLSKPFYNPFSYFCAVCRNLINDAEKNP
jgi:hypothetical protein